VVFRELERLEEAVAAYEAALAVSAENLEYIEQIVSPLAARAAFLQRCWQGLELTVSYSAQLCAASKCGSIQGSTGGECFTCIASPLQPLQHCWQNCTSSPAVELSCVPQESSSSKL
jgi:hypothetical protein